MVLRSDLRAVVRAAGERSVDDPDPAAEAALTPGVRGWDQLDAAERRTELGRARGAVRGEDAHRRGDGTLGDDALDDAVQALLVRLVLGELRRVVVLDVDLDGLRRCALRGDGGIVVADPVGGPDPRWDDLLPAPVDPVVRRYLLAGGVLDGSPDGWRDGADLAARARRALAAAEVERDAAGVEVVLLRRHPGWRALDELAAGVRTAVLPAVDAAAAAYRPDLAAVAAEWCAAGPLRHGYDLAVARIAPADGRVTVSTETLFRAGAPAAPDGERQVSLALERPDGAAGPVLLPVLRAGRAAPADRPAVALPVLDLPGPAVVDLTVPAPGRVEVVAVRPLDPAAAPFWPATATTSPRSWTDLAAEIPQHDAFDVVVAVEMGGEAARADARIEAARNLVRALDAREQRAPGAVRVAALGFTDHGASGRRGAPVSHEEGFAPPAALHDPLSRWFGTPQNNPHGSAVEDALHRAGGLGWRPGALRTLVVLGSRPPSVNRQGSDRSVSCPGGYDWVDELDGLRSRYAVRTVAVVDLPGWYGRPDIEDPFDRTKELWEELGRDGRLDLDGLHAPDLYRAVAPGPEGRVPLAVLARTEDDRG